MIARHGSAGYKCKRMEQVPQARHLSFANVGIGLVELGERDISVSSYAEARRRRLFSNLAQRFVGSFRRSFEHLVSLGLSEDR